MEPPIMFAFVGGSRGPWRVQEVTAVIGESLSPVERLEIVEGIAAVPADADWVLRGVVSNERYATRAEHESLAALQPELGRVEATRAALIPISKSPRWWGLAQDERRAIFEETSRHIAIGLEYLPAVARRLHHGRDLGEPFDFLTWFECAPEHAEAFEELVKRLRGTPEWEFVTREVDIRLSLSTSGEFARRLSNVSPVDLGRPAARDIEELRKERDTLVDSHSLRRRRRSG